MNNQIRTIRCDDNAEAVVFTRYDDGWYEITVEDSYCGGGEYMGIKGRLRRAWHVFWAKPIYYSGICVADKERMKKFLNECLELVDN